MQVLDTKNVVYLFCLHFVFIPQINRHLALWKEGFIRHQIRTAGNRSPMQLFILGLLNLRGSGHCHAREVYEPQTQVIL